jgi:hypothetical protein
MSDLSRGMSGLSVGSGDMERLRQENRDLKRQLGGGGVKPSLAIPWEDIDLGDQISGGGFSVVYRCLCPEPPRAPRYHHTRLSG